MTKPPKSLCGAARGASRRFTLWRLPTFSLLRVCEPRPGSRAGRGQGGQAQRHWASWVGGELAVGFGNDFVAHGEVSVGQVENPILGHGRPAALAKLLAGGFSSGDLDQVDVLLLGVVLRALAGCSRRPTWRGPTMSEKAGLLLGVVARGARLYSA